MKTFLTGRALARASEITGLRFIRACARGAEGEGIVAAGRGHLHYAFNPKTGESRRLDHDWHWESCKGA